MTAAVVVAAAVAVAVVTVVVVVAVKVVAMVVVAVALVATVIAAAAAVATTASFFLPLIVSLAVHFPTDMLLGEAAPNSESTRDNMDTKPLSPMPLLVAVVVVAALMAKRVGNVVVAAVVVTTASATTVQVQAQATPLLGKRRCEPSSTRGTSGTPGWWPESTRPSVWLSDRRLQSGHRRTKSKASRNEEPSGNLQL